MASFAPRAAARTARPVLHFSRCPSFLLLPFQSRHIHASPRSLNSPIFNLNGLSGSREAQYFSKERNIPRTDFASNIELIRSSEVDPFGAPGTTSSARQEHLKEKSSYKPKKEPEYILGRKAVKTAASDAILKTFQDQLSANTEMLSLLQRQQQELETLRKDYYERFSGNSGRSYGFDCLWGIALGVSCTYLYNENPEWWVEKWWSHGSTIQRPIQSQTRKVESEKQIEVMPEWRKEEDARWIAQYYEKQQRLVDQYFREAQAEHPKPSIWRRLLWAPNGVAT